MATARFQFMTSASPVTVEGVALQRSCADPARSLPELIFDCVRAALADAGVRMADVDSVCVAAEDLIDGRSLSSMITGPAAGAYLREEIRLSEDGLAALSLGTAQVQSRDFERVVVAAWGRASEGDPQRSGARSFDPFTEQPLGLSELAVSALRASGYLKRRGGDLPQRAEAVQARADRASANPRAAARPVRTVPAPFPLRPGELRTETDAVAAVVLGRAPAGIAVTGVGHATESRHLGERDLTAMVSARDAARAALSQSGLHWDDLGVLELAGTTLFDEILLLESVGLAAAGTGADVFLADSRINPSGGGAAGDCEPATGLLRFAEAVLRLRDGLAARAGLVVSGSAVGGQTHTAVVIEAS